MNFADIDIIEGISEFDDQERTLALQRAINGGTAWRFQGSYGRAMMDAIVSGLCILGRDPTTDYWGNRIPARDEVVAGTKGSLDYCIERFGIDHATMISEVP